MLPSRNLSRSPLHAARSPSPSPTQAVSLLCLNLQAQRPRAVKALVGAFSLLALIPLDAEPLRANVRLLQVARSVPDLAHRVLPESNDRIRHRSAHTRAAAEYLPSGVEGEPHLRTCRSRIICHVSPPEQLPRVTAEPVHEQQQPEGRHPNVCHISPLPQVYNLHIIAQPSSHKQGRVLLRVVLEHERRSTEAVLVNLVVA